MRPTPFAAVLILFAARALAAPVSPDEVRQLLAPQLAVCMEVPIGAFRIGPDDKALEARVNGLQARGLVTVRTIGQGDSLASGASDLDRLEEEHLFSRLVDVALADGVDRTELCPLPHHRVGVPLGTQTVTGLTKIEPADDGDEAKLVVEGVIDRVLSKYAPRVDPALTARAVFRAELVYDLAAKAWVVRTFNARSVGVRTN